MAKPKKRRSPRLYKRESDYIKTLWEASKSLGHKNATVLDEVLTTVCYFQRSLGWSLASISNAIGITEHTLAQHMKKAVCRSAVWDTPCDGSGHGWRVPFPASPRNRTPKAAQQVYVVVTDDAKFAGVFGSRSLANNFIASNGGQVSATNVIRSVKAPQG